MAQRQTNQQQHPLFDNPGARADFKRARQLERFTPQEAAAYLIGYEPEFVNCDIIRPFQDSPQAKQFLWTLKVIGRAIDANALVESIDPIQLIVWAREKDIDVPEDFIAAYENERKLCNNECYERKIEELKKENEQLKKQLAEPPPKSRRSYQLILLAAAVDGMNYKGNKGSEVPQRITSAATRLGLNITQSVVSDHLRDAKNDLEPDLSSYVEK